MIIRILAFLSVSVFYLYFIIVKKGSTLISKCASQYILHFFIAHDKYERSTTYFRRRSVKKTFVYIFNTYIDIMLFY